MSGATMRRIQRSEMDHELDVAQLIRRSGMPQKLRCRFLDLFPIRVVATLPVDDRHL